MRFFSFSGDHRRLFPNKERDIIETRLKDKKPAKMPNTSKLIYEFNVTKINFST